MSITKSQPKVYFKNLNAIRFIAASLVIIHHTEQIKNIFHIENNWGNQGVAIVGKLGVILFFVLSGFLISYLLFKEKDTIGNIDVKKFYVRRILRIWPLYFLIVIMAFFIFPFVDALSIPGYESLGSKGNVVEMFLLYIFMMPNIVLTVYGVVPYASQLWSIGTEEQFYLIWPILNKKINNKWLLMLSVIGIYLIIKIILNFSPDSSSIELYRKIWNTVPIDCMAIGGVFAIIAYSQSAMVKKIKSILFNKILQWCVLALTIYFLIIGYVLPSPIGFFHYEFYSILFGVLILNFACNENRIFSMENSILNFLGRISYGLYMFHSVSIVLAIYLCSTFDQSSNFLLYSIIFSFTIVIASLSYYLFENRFIKLKTNYSHILSGANAKQPKL
ncbi:acyltransferase family protein [Brumimicrobium aurantiacum]|uniref:Acyltransferase n=1 Tax=Brumimicrobium aurantiacum TaxID=1737063 RepID=A0A3E1F1P7_9FLAO|nr:acyltransferase [Brumimicrobium aurantiacum]RFC55736.1 acyltransferase [Brumimicrobium aurantiacum]